MIFKTENSTYEIDAQQKRIRRLSGDYNPPTAGFDGNNIWRHYLRVDDLDVGRRGLFWWTETKAMRTSEIQTIERDGPELHKLATAADRDTLADMALMPYEANYLASICL